MIDIDALLVALESLYNRTEVQFSDWSLMIYQQITFGEMLIALLLTLIFALMILKFVWGVMR